MKSLMAAPYIPISSNIGSHRAALAVIRANQLELSGVKDLTINMSLKLYRPDYNEFDVLYAYHGPEFKPLPEPKSSQANLFGGLAYFPHSYNFANFSKFKGKVFSIDIDFPPYHEIMRLKMEEMRAAGNWDKIDPMWHTSDWDNLKRMYETSETVKPNELIMKKTSSVAIGDSHALCMYRPGWVLESVPFKTLYGALKERLVSFIPRQMAGYANNIEFYFGNIDIRHHLLRQPNPKEAVELLVDEYFKQADAIGCPVRLWEPLPIENESRSVPKTGWYKGTPFYGSWVERKKIRDYFVMEMERRQTNRVRLYKWTSGLTNDVGELSFDVMEKPKNIHLSREFYPHWTGEEYNRLPATDTLEQFFL